MSHEDTGCTRINVVTQHQHDLFASVRIQRAGRLVGKNDRAVTDQSTRDGDALALPTRESFWEAVSKFGDADLFEGRHGRLAHLRGAHSVELERHFNVFECRQRGNQVVVLEDVPDRAAAYLRAVHAIERRQVDAVDVDAPVRGALESAGDRQQRRLTGVGHEFGANGVRVRALDGIDLEVAPGELLAVMGPSGSGKSTLLSLAGGLERPTHGSVYVNGIDLAGLDSVHRAEVRRRSIGYVFQDYNLIPSLSALENVEMPLQLDGVSPSKVREAAMAALTEVGVAELADRFPERLSGGQRQRVAIARGLVGNRSVILADEPTGALDSHTGEQIMLVLRNHIDAGAAGILVTHEARMAAWADRTVFLRDGRIVDRSRGDSLRDLLADAAPRI